ncbi:MAG TPA: class I SAM-dependent methyltransferase [Myxococcota bacterium]|jgi:SAM-dependent methyltransferase
MRVVDLDRDMSDVIPTGTTRDSEFLFARMTRATLDATGAAPGSRILDVASGFGQDAASLRARGAEVVGAEPSARMTGWARLVSEKAAGPAPHWVRGWSDALPFADASFDASYCKGALDHFDRPELAIAEMARVTRPGGRVILAVANFDSLACRAARAHDRLREGALGREPRRGRRHYDVPADHFTRYELGLLREHAQRALAIESVTGLSLAWGLPSWTRFVERAPVFLAHAALRAADFGARLAPGLADVIVLVGTPRH